MLWGIIWIVGFAAEQFVSRAYRIWLPLDAIGLVATFFLGAWSRRSPVKGAKYSRIGLSWAILFAYGALWGCLLYPWGMSHRLGWATYAPLLERKMAAFCVTLCMFAYVVMGLWLDRFLLWLGALVTAATLLGYFFEPDYFYLWIAVGGGGSLVAVGAFIRKFWR